MAGEGGVDVTLAWEGGPRDLMIQLYRADVGLIHEDLAPRGGSSRITFRRPDLAPMDYQLRVVSMQKDVAISFMLTYTQFENSSAARAEARQQFHEVGRRRGLESQQPSIGGMPEAQHARVKRLATEDNGTQRLRSKRIPPLPH